MTMFLRKPSPPLILLVDDEPYQVETASYIAYELGCDFDSATSGKEALEKVAQRPPDLILLDVRMPDLSGYEVCRRIKTDPATSDIQIIFVTARIDEEDLLQGFEALANDYITKPFSAREFKARSKNALRTKELLDTMLARTRFLELQQEVTDRFDETLGDEPADLDTVTTAVLDKISAFFMVAGASLQTRPAGAHDVRSFVSTTWPQGAAPAYLSALTLVDDPRVDRAPRLPGTYRESAAEWVITAAPLWIGEDLTGTLRLHREGVFSPAEHSTELEHLVSLASHLARAVHRAELIESLKGRAQA
jgi:DNA-binding response OmpR family regulator